MDPDVSKTTSMLGLWICRSIKVSGDTRACVGRTKDKPKVVVAAITKNAQKRVRMMEKGTPAFKASAEALAI